MSEQTEQARRETERMATELAKITRREIFGHARKMLARKYDRLPNWVVAKEMFGTGSTYAWALCAEMGIDGDAYTANPFPPLPAPATPQEETL